MTFKIPNSSSRSTGANSALEQIDPHRAFGNKSKQLQNRVVIPDLAGIEYQGDSAMAKAFGSVANDLVNVAADINKREQLIKNGKERDRRDVATRAYQVEVTARDRVIEMEGKENGWTVEKTAGEKLKGRKSLRQHFINNNKFEDERIADELIKGLDFVDITDNVAKSNWSLNAHVQEGKELFERANDLNHQALEVSDNANDIFAFTSSQNSKLEQRSQADVTMTAEQVQAGKEGNAMQYLQTFVKAQRRTGKITSFEDIEDMVGNILSVNPEFAELINLPELQKELKQFNKVVEAEEKHEQNKIDSSLSGAVEFALVTDGSIHNADGTTDKVTEDLIINSPASDHTKAKLISLLKADTKARLTIVKDAEWANKQAQREPGYFFGRNNVKDRAAVEAQSEQFDKTNESLMGGNPAAGWKARAKNAVDMGAISSKVKGDIIRLLQSDDPTQAAFGVDALNIIETANPLLIEQEFGEYNKPVLLMADLLSEGYGLEEAKGIVQRDAQMPPEVRKALEEKAKDELSDNVSETLDDYLDNHPVYDWDLFGQPSIPVELSEQFKKIRNRLFVSNGGNAELAKSRALKTVFGKWGRTNIDGSDRWMVKAPELVYGNGSESPWIKEQFVFWLTERGIDSDNVSVVINPATANNKKPTYFVMDHNQFGQIIRTDDNTVWEYQPDFETYEADEIAMKVAARDLEIAKEKATQNSRRAGAAASRRKANSKRKANKNSTTEKSKAEKVAARDEANKEHVGKSATIKSEDFKKAAREEANKKFLEKQAKRDEEIAAQKLADEKEEERRKKVKRTGRNKRRKK